MKLYLDVSCLNRPFDDQNQARIRLESEAVVFILERVDTGVWSLVLGKRHWRELRVAVANPLDWLKEQGDARDA